jgi:hypothetical protein
MTATFGTLATRAVRPQTGRVTDPGNPPTVTAAVARRRFDAGMLGLVWAAVLAFSLVHDGHWPRVVLQSVLMAVVWTLMFLGLWHDAPSLAALEQTALPLPTGIPVQRLGAHARQAVVWLVAAVGLMIAIDLLLGPTGSTSGIFAGMMITKLVHSRRFQTFERRSETHLLLGVVGNRWRRHTFYYVRPA